MGSNMCAALLPSEQSEVIKEKKHLITIRGPPQLQKLEPIKCLSFYEENIEIEKEKYVFTSKETNNENTQSKKEIALVQLENPQIPSTAEAIRICQFNQQQEQLNNSKEDSNCSLLEIKAKSILKNKGIDGSCPPVNANKDIESIGSQRSIKKVTFDKKQKVVYSSFRKPKH